MQRLNILNKKEIKRILELIKEQWGVKLSLDVVFLKSNKEKLYIAGKEVFTIDLKKLRVNSLGLYFGELRESTLRLSIEGSQIVGPKATKNVIELTDEELKTWLKGGNIVLRTGNSYSNFVIIEHKNDFFGCGKYSNGKLLNYFPKVRRIYAE